MKEKFGAQLNELMVDTFDSIRKIEENSLKARHDNKLSISEYHLLESVGKGSMEEGPVKMPAVYGGKTISEIAQDLGITNASVTVAVNNLVRKGFVEKARCIEDGRVVYVYLTREGRRINAGHRLFHQHLIRSITKEFDDTELEILVRCIDRINAYFEKYK